VEFKKCVSVFDANGRFNPAYDENAIEIVKADYVLIAIGQSIDWGKLLEESIAELNPIKRSKQTHSPIKPLNLISSRVVM
jgi:hypothetical protein